MTKLKGWTAGRAVKIICFVLICASCFLISWSFYSAIELTDETGISPDIMFADLSTNRYFHDRHMYNAYYQAMIALYYESEDAIQSGKFFKMRPGGEQNVITQQLMEYRAALEYLNSAEGLVYYLSGPGGVVPGSITAGSDRFATFPVYIIRVGNDFRDSSHDNDYRYWNRFDYSYSPNGAAPDNMEIFLAFTNEYVNAQNASYREMQMAYREDFAVIGACMLLSLLLTVILLLGAGRKRNQLRIRNEELGINGGEIVSDSSDIYGCDNSRDKAVHFALIDKPFLDISLAVLFMWCLGIVFIAADTLNYLTRNSSFELTVAFLTAASVVFVIPVLLWLLSLAKRVKAGEFWKHTLIYFVPSRCWRLAKSLWAGWPLTAKVVAISAVSLILMFIITGAATSEAFLAVILSLLFTGAAAFLLLRYAVRIRKLKEGAADVSGGDYDLRIDAGGGELGSIADSINSISAGINAAVEQRMKSERLKTELITNVSHDIRTPLTSIITYLDLLKNEGLDAEQAPEYLDVLVQKSQRMKTLTDELFEAAKAASGNIDVNLTGLDIISLINQVLGEMDGSIKESELDLRTNLPSSLIVKADGKLMWRVMENLLSNALKYSLSGSRIYLDVVQEDLMARIDIKNVSAGELNFDPAELTERFKRGDDSRADGGSGLGLSIVQSFVAAQGGKFAISIDGDLFKASTYLPLS